LSIIGDDQGVGTGPVGLAGAAGFAGVAAAGAADFGDAAPAGATGLVGTAAAGTAAAGALEDGPEGAAFSATGVFSPSGGGDGGVFGSSAIYRRPAFLTSSIGRSFVSQRTSLAQQEPRSQSETISSNSLRSYQSTTSDHFRQ